MVNIDDCNFSEQCLIELKRTGLTEVEDLIFVLEDQINGLSTIRAGWLKYFREIREQLKILGL